MSGGGVLSRSHTGRSQSDVLVAAAGAACIASSAMLVRLADTTPATAAAFRCLLSVPLLAALMWFQTLGAPPRPSRSRLMGLGSGLFFTFDLYLWHHCIADAGAGVATVLGNLQVVVVAAVGWAVLKEKPSSRLLIGLPVVFGGVVLVSGLIGPAAYGNHPLRGAVYGLLTSVAYAGFILLLRAASAGTTSTAAPLLDATVTAGVLAIALGAVTDGVDLTPGWSSLGWLALLALFSQVIGWLLISRSLPHLPAAVTALILLLQPLGALVLGAVVLSERPSWVQLLGSALVLGGVVYGSGAGRRAPDRPAPEAVAAAPAPLAASR
jgi:drug/metabolite transporter (DMT)-like permease